ncbi:MAG: hypothetical protein V1685_05450 [Parcubacteria group bacterium]
MDPQPMPPQKQNVKKYLKIFGYGFLLFIVTNILLFILSMVIGTVETENPMAKHSWVGIVLAILISGCSWLFSRRFHPTSTKQAFSYGVMWAILNLGFMLFVTIPNETTGIIFGQWSTYLIYIGIAVGPALGNKKKSPPAEARGDTKSN